jgi:hypothetical protein
VRRGARDYPIGFCRLREGSAPPDDEASFDLPYRRLLQAGVRRPGRMARIRERPGGVVLHTERMDHLRLHDHRVFDIPLGEEHRGASRGPGGELAVHLEAVPGTTKNARSLMSPHEPAQAWALSMRTGSARRRRPARPPVRADGAVAVTIRPLPLKRGHRQRRPLRL